MEKVHSMNSASGLFISSCNREEDNKLNTLFDECMIARFNNSHSDLMQQAILNTVNEKRITLQPECQQAAALMLEHCCTNRLTVWFEPTSNGGQYAKCYLLYIRDADELINKLIMLGANIGTRTDAIVAKFPPAVADSLHPALDINTYLQDGFIKIAQVLPYRKTQWTYIAIDKVTERDMFSNHFSWLYMIVSGREVVKVGESGNPLAIYGTKTYVKPSGESRLGRYTTGSGTDKNIRDGLVEEVANGTVYIYAKKLPISYVDTTIAGNAHRTPSTTHRHYEKQVLAFIADESKLLPRLNKGQS
jgi:hypothetical protein